MRYLVDTDWVVEYLKGIDRATQTLAKLAPQGLAISIITFGEIYEGIYYGRDPEAHEYWFRQFIRSVRVLPLNRSEDISAGDVREAGDRRHAFGLRPLACARGAQENDIHALIC